MLSECRWAALSYAKRQVWFLRAWQAIQPTLYDSRALFLSKPVDEEDLPLSALRSSSSRHATEDPEIPALFTNVSLAAHVHCSHAFCRSSFQMHGMHLICSLSAVYILLQSALSVFHYDLQAQGIPNFHADSYVSNEWAKLSEVEKQAYRNRWAQNDRANAMWIASSQ